MYALQRFKLFFKNQSLAAKMQDFGSVSAVQLQLNAWKRSGTKMGSSGGFVGHAHSSCSLSSRGRKSTSLLVVSSGLPEGGGPRHYVAFENGYRSRASTSARLIAHTPLLARNVHYSVSVVFVHGDAFLIRGRENVKLFCHEF